MPDFAARTGRAAARRRSATDRNRQGAVAGNRHSDHGRADQRAYRVGSRAAVSRDRPLAGPGRDRAVHLAQAGRGVSAGRSHRRAARRPPGRSARAQPGRRAGRDALDGRARNRRDRSFAAAAARRSGAGGREPVAPSARACAAVAAGGHFAPVAARRDSGNRRPDGGRTDRVVGVPLRRDVRAAAGADRTRRTRSDVPPSGGRLPRGHGAGDRRSQAAGTVCAPGRRRQYHAVYAATVRACGPAQPPARGTASCRRRAAARREDRQCRDAASPASAAATSRRRSSAAGC